MTDSEEVNYAGFGIRLAATIIDVLLLFVLNFIIQIFSGLVFQASFNPLIASLIGAAVIIWFWTKKGGTPGNYT